MTDQASNQDTRLADRVAAANIILIALGVLLLITGLVLSSVAIITLAVTCIVGSGIAVIVALWLL